MCDFFDAGCHVGDLVNSVTGSALEDMAKEVVEGIGVVLSSLGTLWVYVGTPVLTSGAGGAAGDSSEYALPFNIVLSNVMWICFAIAALSIVILGAMMTVSSRNGNGALAVGRMGYVLGGTILISAASGLVAGLMPSGPIGAGGTVDFLQGSLWWITLAVAIGATMIGGARMAITMRGESGRDVLIGLLRLIVISGAAVGIVGLLVAGFDAYSIWLITESTQCDDGDAGVCFGKNITTLLLLTTASSPLGSILVIIMGIVAIFAGVGQMILILARSGMLVILTGILPTSAAAGMAGESGRAWLNKSLAWLVAFILYKPAAAIVYAAAFQLAGADWFTGLNEGDESGLVSVVTGLMMMVMALVALPALMRLVTPMVGSMAGGGGGGGMLAAAGVAALPTGAAQLGRLGGGGSSGTSTASPSGASVAGSQGPAGQMGSAGKVGSGAASSGGAAAASSGGAAAAGGGAAAGGAAAGGGVAAGASAGAAAGPVGAGVGAAVGAVQQVSSAAKGAVQGLADQSTGEGPSGSN